MSRMSTRAVLEIKAEVTEQRRVRAARNLVGGARQEVLVDVGAEQVELPPSRASTAELLCERNQPSLKGFRSQNRRPLLVPLQQVLVAGDDHIGSVFPSKGHEVVIADVSRCLNLRGDCSAPP